MEGHSLRQAACRRLALEGAGRPRRLERRAPGQGLRQRLRAVRPHLRPRRQQPLRRDHRHHAQPGGRQRGLPLPQHLAPGRHRGRAAGDRLHPRRQQRLGLHRRPDVRRRGARQGRQRGGRQRQLPARHLRLPEPAAVQERRRRGRGFGQFRPARLHQGAALRQPRHRQFRRRRRQRDADGPVGRRHQCLRAGRFAADGGGQPAAVPPRGAAQRRHHADLEPVAGQPAAAGTGVGRAAARQHLAGAAARH